jgi:hypothetical protein
MSEERCSGPVPRDAVPGGVPDTGNLPPSAPFVRSIFVAAR